MKMTTSYFLQVTLFCLLFFERTNRVLGLEAAIIDACADNTTQDEKGVPYVHNIKKSDYTCLLYASTHELNCSWSFQSLEKEAQITTTISVCDQGKAVQTLESKGPVGCKTCLIDKSAEGVVLYVNVSLHNKSMLYYHKFDTISLEVLSPPPNVQARFKDDDLLISWGRPHTDHCPDEEIEYEVQLRDQGKLKYVKNKLSYTENKTKPKQSFNVRIRAKVDHVYCLGSHTWSNWSPPVKILSPPPNVQAWFQNNDLLISWGRPNTSCQDHHIEYEVQLRNQEEPKHVKGKLSYTEKANLTQNYAVRIRTKGDDDFCQGSHSWSNWTPARKPVHQGTAGVIIAISVGIPMILLAVLLLVCQRVFKQLCPPIPSPPQKLFEEYSDAFVVPDLMTIPDEEITFVFYSEDN